MRVTIISLLSVLFVISLIIRIPFIAVDIAIVTMFLSITGKTYYMLFSRNRSLKRFPEEQIKIDADVENTNLTTDEGGHRREIIIEKNGFLSNYY